MPSSRARGRCSWVPVCPFRIEGRKTRNAANVSFVRVIKAGLLASSDSTEHLTRDARLNEERSIISVGAKWGAAGWAPTKRRIVRIALEEFNARRRRPECYRERKRARNARNASAMSLPRRTKCGYGPRKVWEKDQADRLGASDTSFMFFSSTSERQRLPEPRRA